MKEQIKTIPEQITERANIITDIINRKQTINRMVFTSSEWHSQFNALYPLHIDKLKSMVLNVATK